MTLSFTQAINGKPSYFPHKIWKAITYYKLSEANFVNFCYSPWFTKFGETMPMVDDVKAKLHTFRLDPYNRWKPGMKIHPVINNRSVNRFQFAPVLECKSVQKIVIKWFYSKDIVETREHIYNPQPHHYAAIYIDGKNYPLHLHNHLFINDGFDGIEDFFSYFNADFTGKIIHWTDLKY